MDNVERYLSELRDQHLSGAAVPETSGYPAIKALLDAIGKRLKPKVRCLIHLKSKGAGIPDGGLFTADQFPRGAEAPREGQLPGVGALEVKAAEEDIARTIVGDQVLKYVQRYGQVLVTNYREFVLMVRTRHGNAKRADGFTLAATAEEFWKLAAQPRKTAEERGPRLIEFLTRVLRSRAVLTEPADVAWFLASHARDAMDAVGHHDIPTLDAVRSAFEEALGIEFKGEKGDHFFRSSLIQTLFYGIFSGWVLWSREHPPTDETPFDWRNASWHLKVPMIDALFAQIAQPGPIEELGLRAILDRTAEVLNRVDRAVFFQRFQAAEAVQYFYEPFLEAFDPELRKQLGVWYTPREVVKYMVARVDAVLKSELGVARGLADPSVYVLDPCCGTGAYLVEVLERIAQTLKEEGGDAMVASDLRKAARERVFGFELLPAPFVVSHLQLGLLLQRLGAPLGGQKGDRAGVFLTNALTGWDADEHEKTIPFPGMEEERDRSDEVKRSKPILVILGNPPYNGYAGLAVTEERDLSNAYRTTVKAPKPQGQGLNDLYVRFFRMAERKIVEQSGRGVICFISNYSWLDGLSFTGMRERYMEKFDRIWIDNLHGDRVISEYAPDGRTSETVFAIAGSSTGIRIGTAIALLARNVKARGPEPARLLYRDRDEARAEERRAALIAGLKEANPDAAYSPILPSNALGLPFRPRTVGVEYLAWPLVPAIFPDWFSGIKPARDEFLVDIDHRELVSRIESYFDPKISDEEMRRLAPVAMRDTDRFAAAEIRAKLRNRGLNRNAVQKYCYRPFDTRWLYWELETKLLDERREDYHPHVVPQNRWFTIVQRPRKGYDGPLVSTLPCSYHINELSARLVPAGLVAPGGEGLFGPGEGSGSSLRPNQSPTAKAYLESVTESSFDQVFFHAISVMHAPRYGTENSGALLQDTPRIPLPAKKTDLEASAALGRQLADLLDPEIPVPGVSIGALRSDLKQLGVLSTTDHQPIDPERGDLSLTARWGSAGKNGVTMPGKGKVVGRKDGAVDVYLNDRVFWANVPIAVWEYTLGGYQVIKKWLSYRERDLLGRDLKDDEARYVSEMARRIASILALGPELDVNYERVKADIYPWPA